MKEPNPHPACAQPLASTSCTQKPDHQPLSRTSCTRHRQGTAPGQCGASPNAATPGSLSGHKATTVATQAGEGELPLPQATQAPPHSHKPRPEHFKANPVRCQQGRGGAAAGELLKPILHKEQERSLYPSKSFSP